LFRWKVPGRLLLSLQSPLQPEKDDEEDLSGPPAIAPQGQSGS